MAKQLSDAPRQSAFRERPEELTLITDPNHPLHDKRAQDPIEEEFINSIRLLGITAPIWLKKDGEKKLVVAGRRRVKAALIVNKERRDAGAPDEQLVRIPAIYIKGDELDMLMLEIVENEARKQDSPINRAEKLKRLLALGSSEKDAATVFGVSRQTIKNWCDLIELPVSVKKAVERGELPASCASELVKLSSEDQKTRIEELRAQGGKITAERVKTAARTGAPAPVKTMRTRKEVLENLEKLSGITEPENEGKRAYAKGFGDALRWVLYMDEKGGK